MTIDASSSLCTPHPTPTPTTTITPPPLPMGLLALTDWGWLDVQGDDAASFLHGQCTQDILHLGIGRACFASYCTPQGKVIASFMVIRMASQRFAILLPLELQETLCKRLRLFILRAKVTVKPCFIHESELWGSLGEAAIPADLPTSSWSTFSDENTLWIRLPIAQWHEQSIPRALAWILPYTDSNSHFTTPTPHPTPHLTPTTPSISWTTWQCCMVLSGVWFIQSETSQHYIPQMLNYESCEGIHFKKGCYPGQEVVARTQFRGTLKRRLQCFERASAQDGMVIGQDLLDADHEPIGTLLALADDPYLGAWLLAIVPWQTLALDHAEFWVESPTQGMMPIIHHPLPYTLKTDI